MIVGAPFDGGRGSQTGSVYVYKEASKDKWELFDRKIVPTDGKNGDQFGISLDIDELSTLVIGSNVSHLNLRLVSALSYVISNP